MSFPQAYFLNLNNISLPNLCKCPSNPQVQYKYAFKMIHIFLQKSSTTGLLLSVSFLLIQEMTMKSKKKEKDLNGVFLNIFYEFPL